MRTALPWILLALVAGGWIGATVFSNETSVPAGVAATDGESAAATELAELRTAVDGLRAEVQALRAGRAAKGPVLETSGTAPTVRPRAAPRSEAFEAREAERRKERAQRDVRRRHLKAIGDLRKMWYDAVRQLKDADLRRSALAEMRAAFDGKNTVRTLAALQLARWIGDVDYDRGDWRRGIEPHTKSADASVRVAALTALAYVQPEAKDIALWPEVVKTADRNNAEELAQAVVRTADGVIRGEAADAILHLLRDGTEIKKAFVIRGLQSGKEWDPVLEARLIEVVRAARPRDYDSHYYFHFITPRLDPKSDDVLELMLDRIADGKSDIETIARGFRVGLSDAQKDRAADKLLDLAENAGTSHAVRSLAGGLESVATAQHITRMEALAAGDGIDDYAKAAIKRAIQAAQRRR